LMPEPFVRQVALTTRGQGAKEMTR
jgi:hypothetical protein